MPTDKVILVFGKNNNTRLLSFHSFQLRRSDRFLKQMKSEAGERNLRKVNFRKHNTKVFFRKKPKKQFAGKNRLAWMFSFMANLNETIWLNILENSLKALYSPKMD